MGPPPGYVLRQARSGNGVIPIDAVPRDVTADLSEDDRGKTVVSGTERIGTVTDVRGGTAYVDPDFDHVSDGLADALGWSEGDDRYAIPEDAITAVQNAEVRLRDDLY